MNLKTSLSLVLLLLVGAPVLAQDRSKSEPETKQKVGFVMPFEFDYDFGAIAGNALIGRFFPLITVPLGEKWQYHNLTLAVIADAPGGRPGFPGNPDAVIGEKAFGLGDWINISTFLPALNSDKFIFGFGFAMGIPLATNPGFGSGKWSIGPSLRIGFNPGKWRINFLGGNLWSYAGDSERGEVNQMIIRGLIRRPFGSKWFFTSNPIITANWNAGRGQRWLVPLGGGIGNNFNLFKMDMSLAVHGYLNVERPAGAPKGLVRVDLLFKQSALPIPK
ncbi:MAG: hypothetical protein WBM43_12600 [Flavobacteriaceae bacterium]